MRVICIENSIMIDIGKPDFGSIYAHKGSVYNVVRVIQGELLKRIRSLVRILRITRISSLHQIPRNT